MPRCPCRWVKLRLSTKAIKTVEKRGLQVMADEAGIDLWKLPFEDARPQRKEWLASNPQVHRGLQPSQRHTCWIEALGADAHRSLH